MEKFSIENIKEIVSKIDEIQDISTNSLYGERKCPKEVQQLLRVIDGLARAAGMFGDIKEQELTGKVVTDEKR